MAGAFRSWVLRNLPVFELHPCQPHVLAAAGKAEPGHGDDPLHRFGLLLQEMLLHLAYHLDGPLLGGAGRQLHLAEKESLVLIRQE